MQTSPVKPKSDFRAKGRRISNISDLTQPGTYILLVDVHNQVQVNVGSLGKQAFCQGLYAYTGSALGLYSTSLSRRLSRHLRADKKKHWHIDYLLSHPKVTINGIVAILTEQKLECKVNRFIERVMMGAIPVLGFGSSDCRDCESHLLLLRDETDTGTLVTRLEKFVPDAIVSEVAF
ncbi:MAG: GIY-YIG nuclease family protein [Candidatus Bathyarchaeia archaeon]